MRRLLSLKHLGIICMASFLLVAPQVFAQESDDFSIGDEGPGDAGGETEAAEESTLDKPETEVIDNLCKRMSRAGDDKYPFCLNFDESKKRWTAITENSKHDPFKPIVKKKVVLPPVRKVQEVKPVEKPKPAAPAVKPIKLFVSGIVGNEGNRLAIVKFENEELTIQKDQIVEGKFKVVDIYSDKVVVYSNKEQRRHTFKIGGDEKE